MPGWGIRRIAGNLEEPVDQDHDQPMAHWSDDQLLDAYRTPTADEGRPDNAALTEEILRRGLSFPDVATVPESETVDWSGEARKEDPGSGALPVSF